MAAILANHGPVHHTQGLEEEPEWGRYMEEGELTESVVSILQVASNHDMEHLDLSYPGLVADDAWHDIPATYTGLDTTPPTQPASYSDDTRSTGPEPPGKGYQSTMEAMDSGNEHDPSSKMQAGHMSLDAARALVQSNLRPMQLLDILAKLTSEQKDDSAQTHASPLRQTWRPEQNPPPTLGAEAAGLPDAAAGPSATSQIAEAQEEEQRSMSATPNEDQEDLPGSSHGDAWAEDATAQYTALEQQLREAHLSEDINWDKLTATVMQQMEHQHM